MTAAALIDTFGREHRDLRVSLTDKCNLRCAYCMPEDFSAWTPSSRLLTRQELVRIVSVAVAQGITTVRLTGGEPLLHPEVVEIVRDLAQLPNAPAISLTTNGLLLGDLVGVRAPQRPHRTGAGAQDAYSAGPGRRGEPRRGSRQHASR